MNERIKQLAEQHGFIHNHMSVGERNDALKKFEKIAELMVIEFSDVVKQTANEITTAGFKGDGTHDEVMLCVNGALSVLDNIRKRFGVEE
jgi:hypothetical protein